MQNYYTTFKDKNIKEDKSHNQISQPMIGRLIILPNFELFINLTRRAHVRCAHARPAKPPECA